MSFLPQHKFFFFAFGCAAFVVAMYHCVLSFICHPRHEDFIEQPQQATGLGEVDILRSIPSHKYITCNKSPKEECPVCLSEFEDGEDLRTLPKCLHTFHVVCIDLCLYSHANCPTCRTDVKPEMHELQQTGTINSGSNGGVAINLVSSRLSQDLEAQHAAELEKIADALQGDWTILHYESSNGNAERVQFIAEVFANKTYLVKTDEEGHTALHLAVDRGEVGVVEALIDAARSLLSSSADHDDPQSKPDSSLANYDDLQFKPVSAFSAFVRQVNKWNNSALHIAVAYGTLATVELYT